MLTSIATSQALGIERQQKRLLTMKKNLCATTWRTRGVLTAFCALTVVTTFVNKHVLSDLKFTYPTIFQSWQTGSVALTLLFMNALGYIELNIVPINSTVLVSWLPASLLFSGIIYSGSVALSRLPVPVFCAMHYSCALFVTLLDSFLLKKVIKVFTCYLS